MVSSELYLRDGGRYCLRPLSLADVGTLQAFFYSHSMETVRHRYGYSLKQMSLHRAQELCGVDQARDPALGIFDANNQVAELHAVGRYFLDGDKQSGEMAFVVRENKRRLGMANILLETLLCIARQRGLKRLWAQVERDNIPMLHLFQRHGARTASGSEVNSLIVELILVDTVISGNNLSGSLSPKQSAC